MCACVCVVRQLSKGSILAPTVIPLKWYIIMTLFFAPMSFLNNKAFDFNITQPVHMVFRSSSLVVVCAVGALFYSKRYTARELVCVAVVTVGVVCATSAEALFGVVAHPGCCDEEASPPLVHDDASVMEAGASSGAPQQLLRWCVGISMLVLVMLLGAFLGQVQNKCRLQFGEAPVESMFYSHLLSLPLYLPALADLSTHANLWSASPPSSRALAFLFSGTTHYSAQAFAAFPGEWTGMGRVGAVPVMWVYVLANLVTQYACITSVYTLISRYSSLTVTLTLTVRKVVSLMLSLWFFSNPFTPFHWAGSVCVFCGALMYALRPAPPSKQKAA